MSPLDAIFLAAERPTNPMHIGGLQLFQPPPGATAVDVRALFDSDPASVIEPFFSRRPVRSWQTAGQWTWREEPTVNLVDHVHSHTLRQPGSVRELLALCSTLHEGALSRARPLWQAHLINGLADGRFAMYFKLHHSLGDGINAQRILSQAMSTSAAHRGQLAPWLLDPLARAQSVTARSAAPVRPRALLEDVASAIRRTAAERGWLAAADGGAPAQVPAAPRTILNVPSISSSRRFAAQSWSMDRLRSVADNARVTLNDVVLAMCSGALRSYLIELNALPEQSLTAMVPTALRDTGALGAHSKNAVGAIMCPLATDLPDAARRLGRIHEAMVAGKAALRAMTPTQVLAHTALGMSPLLFEPVLGRLSRTHPPFNLIISNVPGPRTPLYFNGARLQSTYPLSIPADGQALNITCTSYLDDVSFGLTGCAENVPHLQRLLGFLEQALADLQVSVRP